MFKSTNFRASLLKISYCGRLLFQTWITLLLVYLLFYKAFLEILLWAKCVLKQRIIWIAKELCVDFLWHAVLEQVQNDCCKLVISKSKEYDICTCPCSRNLNRSFLLCKHFNIKTPLRKSLSDDTNIRESMHFNKISSSRVLNEKRNRKNKTSDSDYCRCEPSNILHNQTLLKCSNKQNCSKNRNEAELNERQNLFEEKSSLKCQDATPDSVKLPHEIYDTEREKIKFETKAKIVNLNTPLNSPAYIMPISETPFNKRNMLLRKSRLELMFSDENPISDSSSENESFFKRNWNKWKHFSKIDKINFKKRNVSTQTIAYQTKNSKIDVLEERSDVFIAMQTPEISNCCSNMLCRLKTKLNQDVQESSVTYKRF